MRVADSLVKPSKSEGECAVCSDAGAAARQGCKVTDPTPGLMTYPRPRPHQTSSNRHLVGLPTLITLITAAILRRRLQKRAAVELSESTHLRSTFFCFMCE